MATTWTATTFKARYADFKTVPDATVAAALAEADDETDARVYGDSYERAVGLLAAHILCTTALGERARTDGAAPGETTYLLERKRLTRERAGGPFVIGQRLDDTVEE